MYHKHVIGPTFRWNGYINEYGIFKNPNLCKMQSVRSLISTFSCKIKMKLRFQVLLNYNSKHTFGCKTIGEREEENYEMNKTVSK